MRIQEIQRVAGDKEGLSTKGQNWGKETLSKIKMLPGSQRFGYTAGAAGRAGSFLTGANTIIELFDVKHPEDGLRKAGFLALRSASWFPIKNSYQVANVGLDEEYRGTGLGQNLYGIAMKLLGMTIVADDTQTPQARSSWLRLSQVPGVTINGYTSVFPDEWALRNNRNEIYDDSAKRLISSLLKAGGQEIGKTPDFVYVSFPVGANANQNELQALQKGMAIYSSRHPEDGGTQNGLYARWGGQVNEQGDDPWGPQGNFAGDKPINVGYVTMKIIQVGDIVKYLGQRARVVGMSKNRKYSRISIESEFGGITKDVLTADLKQLGQGMEEGSKRKKKKTSRSLGRYFFPGYGYYGSGESGGGSGDGGGGESINRGVAEKINPKTMTQGFRQDKDMGWYKLIALGDFSSRGAEDPPTLKIVAQLASTSPRGGPTIGELDLKIAHGIYLKNNPGAEALVAAGVYVEDEYKRKGVASAMYKFAKEIGNDIIASVDQSDDAKAMWANMNTKGVAEGFDKEAEAYKSHLLKTAPKLMDFLVKAVKGWRPSEEEMLGAIDTGYIVMKHTGDVKQAGKAMMDELNTLHRMSQGQQGVAETEKNPHTSALGKALYRDLSKQPKLSPQQVQRNKERWAQRQAERGQGVEEARMSAAQRLSNAWDKQRAKSDASLRRTPSSIPKTTPEPKKTDTEPKAVSESRVKRRALMAQMLNNR